MGYVFALVVAAICIELLLLVIYRKAGGDAGKLAKQPAVPIFSQMEPQKREYLPLEIRILEKEAQYRRERRAAQMGYCLLPREANFRNVPGQHRD